MYAYPECYNLGLWEVIVPVHIAKKMQLKYIKFYHEVTDYAENLAWQYPFS